MLYTSKQENESRQQASSKENKPSEGNSKTKEAKTPKHQKTISASSKPRMHSGKPFIQKEFFKVSNANLARRCATQLAEEGIALTFNPMNCDLRSAISERMVPKLAFRKLLLRTRSTATILSDSNTQGFKPQSLQNKMPLKMAMISTT
ncbi:hypothetical protein Dsin_016534 [Dipteronia sinensis]|uniref:Uncharacterized protein n=1 Tax=Dipteronia sinensis TaxID=43782 RepID=A0AAE0AE91_9ROSI|nr:hypothetical protein Dsin_016534 [Dipteronia sinensis]